MKKVLEGDVRSSFILVVVIKSGDCEMGDMHLRFMSSTQRRAIKNRSRKALELLKG